MREDSSNRYRNSTKKAPLFFKSSPLLAPASSGDSTPGTRCPNLQWGKAQVWPSYRLPENGDLRLGGSKEKSNIARAVPQVHGADTIKASQTSPDCRNAQDGLRHSLESVDDVGRVEPITDVFQVKLMHVLAISDLKDGNVEILLQSSTQRALRCW